MKRVFIPIFVSLLFFPLGGIKGQSGKLSSYEVAKRHPIVHEGPAPDFFEGALLGNGGLGAVLCTRPDAVVIRFAHNNVWDIRIAENHKEELGTFHEVFGKVKEVASTSSDFRGDPWYRKYYNMSRENYDKPYPRPFPCGSLILGFDMRKVELLDHKLDIADGVAEVRLLLDRRDTAYLKVFTDMDADRVWMKLEGEDGKILTNCFDRICLLPDRSTPKEFPRYNIQNKENIISFSQVMPYLEPDVYDVSKGHPKDRAFSLSVRAGNSLSKRERVSWHGDTVGMSALEYAIGPSGPFWLCAEIREGLAEGFDSGHAGLEVLKMEDVDKASAGSREVWKNYWGRSGIDIEDDFLESIWYRNLYFMNCATKSGVRCPGLFANWNYKEIGTAWHGDYHMNYNTQQPFWHTFSSNHLEKNLPYVEMVEFISDVARKWAGNYYQMRGAYYPHSAYPVDMTISPYPVPSWGWEICETPWTVQGVWWHYLYSGDKDFLKDRAFPLLKDATLFIVDYMTRPDAYGPHWNDKEYHVYPTVSPELNNGLVRELEKNKDCLVDLTLIKFLFNSYLESVDILGYGKLEKETVKTVEEILKNYPDYPVAESKEYGKVFVSLEGENPDIVYNTPNPLMTVFPGEEHGLHSDAETLEILENTRDNLKCEGGNELVFQHLQAARLGILDLEKFKRSIRYNLLENGTAAINLNQVGGRQKDWTDFKGRGQMGIWFENFSLPAVINECLMQSYNGTIRFFPNWPMEKDAEFSQLRAAGAFLVSASLKDGKVHRIEIFSEVGSDLKMILPWKECTVESSSGKMKRVSSPFETRTEKNERLIFKPIL